jgi:hypothetical protein
MQQSLGSLSEAVRDFANAELRLTVLRHTNQDYHVEANLRLPGQTLFTSDWDPYLDSAFQRCLRKLVRKAEASRPRPDREQAARRREALDRDIVAPRDADAGPLGRAIAAGDYRTFRRLLAGYEDWLRTRAGRWLQRYPEAEARVGDRLLIGDLVEETYLNAFERYGQRPADVPFHAWLDRLIDPSLKALLRHPDEVSENARMARSLREVPLRP